MALDKEYWDVNISDKRENQLLWQSLKKSAPKQSPNKFNRDVIEDTFTQEVTQNKEYYFKKVIKNSEITSLDIKTVQTDYAQKHGTFSMQELKNNSYYFSYQHSNAGNVDLGIKQLDKETAENTLISLAATHFADCFEKIANQESFEKLSETFKRTYRKSYVKKGYIRY